MDADLDTLATAPYVRTDDLLKASPVRAPWHPRVGTAPQISDAEMITLAVMKALRCRPPPEGLGQVLINAGGGIHQARRP